MIYCRSIADAIPQPGITNTEANGLDLCNTQNEEILTPDDLLGFQWQIACGMVTL